MCNYKETSYAKMEKPKKEKKFKQNSYEEIRKLIEENEGNDTVKEIAKSKKLNINKEKPDNFTLFD